MPQAALATHIRAGQITAERDPGSTNPYAYIFTLTLYRDTQGVDQPNATLDFGVDGATQTVPVGYRNRPNGTQLGNNIEELRYTFRYTYPGPNTYTVRFTEENRNAGVVNMFQSVNTAFHIETEFIVSATLGLNNSVVLRNPPIDRATVGQRFCHNPSAFDPDGDSLSYRLVTPLSKKGTEVTGYQDPNRVLPLGTPESGSGAPTFTIDPVTGDICWDAPGPRKRDGGVIVSADDYAEYNIAFVVEEWRKTTNGYRAVGSVRRDMQIRVEFNPNKRPELIIPNDTCVVAGTDLEKFIRAIDPDGHPVSIGSESAIFSTDRDVFPNQPPATLTPYATIEKPVFQDSPAQSLFKWQTDCQHVRAQPYAVVFRAEDNPSNIAQRLTDTKTWLIRVVGPKPTGLKATPAGKTMQLTWDPYRCPNASQIIIWRKIGCEQDSIDACQTGAPPGYVEVGRVPANTFSFVDNNAGKGLETGQPYSYRIGATFAPPGRGESAPSDAVCARLLLDVPLITNVSVLRTSQNGKIEVRWAQPLEIDQKQFPGPYTYEIYRGEGFAGNNYGPAPLETRRFNSISRNNDTLFVDETAGLNTLQQPYHYQIRFYTGTTQAFKDTSKAASSVRLSARPLPRAIELSWQAQVPWNNQNQTHKLYRINQNNEASPVFLADVPVSQEGSFRYVDQGLSEDSVYCYKVLTFGRYEGVPLRVPPPNSPFLTNYSQSICTTPLDTIRPCPPVLAIDPTECDKWQADPKSFCNQTSFTNRLEWTYPESLNNQRCDKDVVKYRIYYSRYQGEGEQFVLLDSVVSQVPMPASFYLHGNLTSYAGCYYVTAVDRSGNESGPSNTVCKDNCPYYALPNVITPNGDGKNELLEPFPCPRFVESVSFAAYNRWGRKVFETSDDILIKWNGRMGKGGETSDEELSTGVYYYQAEVKFYRLRRSDEVFKIKGWVHILK
ncbi:MAG: gliding motility-associated C-terminal domain-containing protein [Cytophagales bacterium]|nr:gliding motility-associated C-terminal domain-containing protein [Cytophagales bacterium]